MTEQKIRVLVAKPGLDGHDRGAKVIARALRDAGMEVIYTGLRQTPEMIVTAALQEDVNVIGLSILSGAHNAIVPRVMDLLKQNKWTMYSLLLGGIIPDQDVERLKTGGSGGHLSAGYRHGRYRAIHPRKCEGPGVPAGWKCCKDCCHERSSVPESDFPQGPSEYSEIMIDLSTRLRDILAPTIGPAPWYWQTFPAMTSIAGQRYGLDLPGIRRSGSLRGDARTGTGTGYTATGSNTYCRPFFVPPIVPGDLVPGRAQHPAGVF